MLGSSTSFGQSSVGPVGSPSVFGQSRNSSSNPFGSTGSQTGGAIFGGTSTGVFGATHSSPPLPSTFTFDAPSSPAFGRTMTCFGPSSTPAFGNSSSSFGSLFGQKPAFGGSGSITSPFNSAFQQTQSTFGSSAFGSSTLFGASSQLTSGAASSPTLGTTSTPAFGAPTTAAFVFTPTPTFGTTPACVFPPAPTFVTTPACVFPPAPTFVTTLACLVPPAPTFNNRGTCGASIAPAFLLGGACGASSTSVFGPSSTPAFGSSSTPTFGASSTPAFRASSTPVFSSTPAFGQSTSTSVAQTTASTFGSTSFGQSAFGGQCEGSRVAVYTKTPEAYGSSGTQLAGKLGSISAMPVFKVKSHEELRWEDYQFGDKGGPNPPVKSVGGNGYGAFTTQSDPFSPSPMFGLSSENPSAPSTSSNPFAPRTSASGASGLGASSTCSFSSSPFGTSSTANPFGTMSSSTIYVVGATSAPAFGNSTSSSIFSALSSPALGSSSSIFSLASVLGTTTSGSGLGFANTQSSPLFQSAPSLGQTNAAFGQTASSLGHTSAPSLSQSNVSSTPSTKLAGSIFSSTPSLLSTTNQAGFAQTTPSFSKGCFQPAQPAQPAGAFSNINFGQTPAALSSFGGVRSVSGQGTFGQVPATPSTGFVQPSPVRNPFGTLPAIPQMFIGHSESAPLIQYGISSMPVIDKPTPVRTSISLTSRHLSQGRIRLPARKYHPKNDGQKVPFFSNDEKTFDMPRADALFTPRENPRALITGPTEQWPLRANVEKMSLMNASSYMHGNENSAKTSIIQEQTKSVKLNFKPNGVHDDHSTQKGESYITLNGHRSTKAAIVYEHGADVELLMPKLRHLDYYTEPQIEELAAKERAEPGFCCRVKGFVVGRHDYGSIRFAGETDVRQLDLESLVQFNSREVIVYMDESKKPPVGQGLNKPAEVTLLNIKCFDKRTGEQYMDGPKVDKYSEMLMKKAKDQGAESLSYDAVRGEWKFRVQHFSKYGFSDDDEYEVDLGNYAATMT